MSYSYSAEGTSAAEFRENALSIASTSPNIPEGQRSGAKKAAELAADMVDSGIIGIGSVAANISGHVQEGEGSALPTCNISVRAT